MGSPIPSPSRPGHARPGTRAFARQAQLKAAEHARVARDHTAAAASPLRPSFPEPPRPTGVETPARAVAATAGPSSLRPLFSTPQQATSTWPRSGTTTSEPLARVPAPSPLRPVPQPRPAAAPVATPPGTPAWTAGSPAAAPAWATPSAGNFPSRAVRTVDFGRSIPDLLSGGPAVSAAKPQGSQARIAANVEAALVGHRQRASEEEAQQREKARLREEVEQEVNRWATTDRRVALRPVRANYFRSRSFNLTNGTVSVLLIQAGLAPHLAC